MRSAVGIIYRPLRDGSHPRENAPTRTGRALTGSGAIFDSVFLVISALVLIGVVFLLVIFARLDGTYLIKQASDRIRLTV